MHRDASEKLAHEVTELNYSEVCLINDTTDLNDVVMTGWRPSGHQ